MIVGHYAAALVPFSWLKGRCPFWLLLLAANIPEFLWLALALVGVEAPEPRGLLDTTLAGMKVDMLWSHDLLPALGQAVVVGLVVIASTRDARVAATCCGLTFFHVLCDYVVGFEHHVFGPSTPDVALNTYGRVPALAVFIELAFALVCIAWYHRREAAHGRPVPRARRRNLYLAFVVGILIFLPAAFQPMSALLALRHEPNLDLSD